MIDMLHPREVCVAGRRGAELPARIVLQLVLTPIAVIEWRVGEDVIGFDAWVHILVEAVSPFAAEVCLDPSDGKIHLCQPPCGRIGLLPINRDVVAPALVR